MSNKYHAVTFKCGAGPIGKDFNLEIDGKRINHVTNVTIEARIDALTRVTLEFYADVDIDVVAILGETNHIAEDEPNESIEVPEYDLVKEGV